MELKKLKEVEILGHNVKMVWSKKVQGGYVSIGTDGKNEIGISTSTEEHDPFDVVEILMHELSEMIHIFMRLRYDDPSVHGNYKFFMDHKEFEMHNKMLALTFSKFIK